MKTTTDVDRELVFRAYPELRGRQRAVMRARLRQLEREHSHPEQERAERGSRRRRRQADLGDLPYMARGRWGRLGQSLWGPVGAMVPMHVTSTADVGVLTPFTSLPAHLLDGPAIGLQTFDQGVFRFDPWAAYRAKLVTSPGLCAWGTMGSGKTYAMQTAALRLVRYGRHVIVEEDPKGDWVKLAQAVGGQVVQIGPGCQSPTNPLAAPTLRAGADELAARRQVDAHRARLLRQMVLVLRDGKPFTEGEEPCLDAVVEAMRHGTCRASIPGVVQYLADAPQELRALVGQDSVTAMHLVLRRLVSGPLAGMVDTDAEVELDPASPMIVFDTSSMLGADEVTKGIANACLSARVDSLLQCGDGRFRIVIDEEAWAKLRNPYAAQAIDNRLRMTGHWRCSPWLIFHELNDIQQMADLGAHREVVRGIVSKSQIKVVFRQSPAALEMYRDFVQPSEREMEIVRSLPARVGLWRLGERFAVTVQAATVASSHALFDNDEGRAG